MIGAFLLLFFQPAAAQPPSLSPPDIELNASVRARRVTIEKKGEASLVVRAGPDAGSIVDVRAPKANGRKTLNNVQVDVRAEARIGDPSQPSQINPGTGETPPPQ